MHSSSTSSSDARGHLLRIARALGMLALVVIGLDLLAGAALGRVFDASRAGELAGATNLVLERAVPADIHYYGSSRARRHFDPEQIEELTGRSGFNVGANGQGMAYFRVIQELLDARGARPSCVVVNLDVRELYFPTPERAAMLRMYAGASTEADAVLSDVIPWFAVKRWSSLWRFNSMVAPLLMNIGRTEDLGRSGFVPLAERTGPLRPTPGADVEPAGQAADPRVLAWLRAFADRASERGATLLLVTSPRHDVDEQGARIVAPMRRLLARDLATNASAFGYVYADLNEEVFAEFDQADLFVDGGHMNARGAELLSVELAAQIEQHCRGRVGAPVEQGGAAGF